ncbi:MAG: AraC family ligand binding domain-containing protein, partial [Clostridiales bacterium]|nr:AraC family ligand binding domain-containing protein [Clostridiales bacterium]
ILNGETEINRNIYMQDTLNIINSKKLLSQGKLISMRPHTRFIHFPEHTHDYNEIVYMCSGSTTHIINGRKILLQESELLLLTQNAKQEVLPAEKNDIAINFIILPEFFEQSLSMMSDEESPLKKFIIDYIKNNNANNAYLHYRVSDILPIQNLLENLIYTLMNNTQAKLKTSQLTMGLLIFQLLNCTDRLAYSDEQEKFIIEV